MLPLRELQLRLLEALFAADGGPVPGLAEQIRGGEFSAAERIAVYRNNLRTSFRKVLAMEFPVLEQLTGADYFTQLAREFHAAHPSRSGDLQRIGAPLAEFLRAKFGAGDYAYFADVAALEWAWQDSMVAADADSTLDLTALARQPAEDLPRLRFALQPALRLVHSAWPVFTIWDEHRRAAQHGVEPEAIDLGAGAEQVWVRRTEDGRAEARRCGPGELCWLDALAAGATLGSALDAALAAEPAFDVAATLRRAAALGLITDFTI
jgi:hypothetical protein